MNLVDFMTSGRVGVGFTKSLHNFILFSDGMLGGLNASILLRFLLFFVSQKFFDTGFFRDQSMM